MRDLSEWVGRTEERRDVIAPWPAAALHAALDLPGEPPQKGDPLPAFWRWLYFLDAPRRSALGRDGHPERGHGLTPPIELPRRMWAGGRLSFHRPLRIGATATRLSSIASVARKVGRTGPLCFLVVRHETLTADGVVEVEEQDIVYRGAPAGGADADEGRGPPPPRMDETWRRGWTVDPALLFRYSALTYNGHRIHYDVDYCRDVEGYGGLVAHGPLLATLMLELLRQKGPDRPIRGFSFRAHSPVVHTEAFDVCGAPKTREDGRVGADVWVRAQDPRRPGGRLAMTGDVTFGEPR